MVLTPVLERYTRALHKKLNLTFDILTDQHYLRDLYKSFGTALEGSTTNRSTGFRCRRAT